MYHICAHVHSCSYRTRDNVTVHVHVMTERNSKNKIKTKEEWIN